MKNRNETAANEAGGDELWGHAYPRLVGWTVRKGFAPEEAEEIVMEAIEQYLATDQEVTGFGALLQEVGSRINGLARNRRTKKALINVKVTTKGTLPDVTAHPAEQVVSGSWVRQAVDPSEQFESNDWAKKALGLLLERIEGDEELTKVVMKMADGFEEPAEIAKELGLTRAQVYNANRRLLGHVAAVRAAMENE